MRYPWQLGRVYHNWFSFFMIDTKEHWSAPACSIFEINVFFSALSTYLSKGLFENGRDVWSGLHCCAIKAIVAANRNEDLVKWLHSQNFRITSFPGNKKSRRQSWFSSESFRHLQADTYFGCHGQQIFLARFVWVEFQQQMFNETVALSVWLITFDTKSVSSRLETD